MLLGTRNLIAAVVLGLGGLLGGQAHAAMTLDFAISPGMQPLVGSLEQSSGGILSATNLAVSSVSAADSTHVVKMSKYLNLQTAGDGGSNFFILDGLVQQFAGSAPASMTTPAAATTLAANGSGYVFTMKIDNGYISDDLAEQFGAKGGFGWTGLLTLQIQRFDPTLGGTQVDSGSIVLTTPKISPSPAGEELNPSATVPEPASLVMLGLAVACGLGRFRAVARRPRG